MHIRAKALATNRAKKISKIVKCSIQIQSISIKFLENGQKNFDLEYKLLLRHKILNLTPVVSQNKIVLDLYSDETFSLVHNLDYGQIQILRKIYFMAVLLYLAAKYCF